MTSIRERLAAEQATQSFVFRYTPPVGLNDPPMPVLMLERDGQASQRARKEPMASTKNSWQPPRTAQVQ